MPPPDWTAIDTALLMGSLAARAADIESTKRLVAGGGSELNPLIAGKPSNKKLNVVGALAAAAQVGGALSLPKRQRRPFLAGMIGLEAAVAHQNAKGGRHKNFADAMKRPVAAGLIAAFLAHSLMTDDDLTITPAVGKGPAINLEMKF